jgi:hypothetical protein
MSRRYNPIYTGITDKVITAIYDNLEAEKVARSIAAGQDGWDEEYSARFLSAVDALIDPRTEQERAWDEMAADEADTRKSVYPGGL